MAAFDPHAGRCSDAEVAIVGALVVIVALAGVLVRKARRALGRA